MVLYCFLCFYCLLGYVYRRCREMFALVTLFLQFLLPKQCISKGFGDHKPPKIFAACGGLSVKKAPPLRFSGNSKGGGLSYQGGAFLTLIPLISEILLIRVITPPPFHAFPTISEDYAKSTWIWVKFTKKTMQSVELCFRVILGG